MRKDLFEVYEELLTNVMHERDYEIEGLRKSELLNLYTMVKTFKRSNDLLYVEGKISIYEHRDRIIYTNAMIDCLDFAWARA